jgi:phage gp36-like protein
MYTTRQKITAKLPDRFLVEALDDDNDGEEDTGLLDTIIANADEEIDSYLLARYAAPFADAPALVGSASLTLVLEALYFRRGLSGDSNPWVKPAAEIRARLKRIAAGDEPLVAGREKAQAGVVVVTEPARTHSTSGRLLA